MATINGRAYAHNECVIQFAGIPVIGIEALSWDSTSETELGYGTSRRAVRYSRGTINNTGTITIHAEEVAKIQRGILAQGYSSVIDLPPVDVIITYGVALDAESNLAIDKLPYTVRLLGCTFTGKSMGSDAGTFGINAEWTFICDRIEEE